MKQLTDLQLSYIAGFLDGDGSINAQILKREDYTFKFQIRVSITFFQKTSRHWVMLCLKKAFGCGTVRKRIDGISEYAIVGKDHVKPCLEALKPYLKIKRKQCTLVLKIISTISKNKKDQTLQDLYASCELVDKIGPLNDSKKRTSWNKSSVVKFFLEPDAYPVPVETSIEEDYT